LNLFSGLPAAAQSSVELQPRHHSYGAGKGNLVLQDSGIFRLQGAASDTINGLNSASATTQVQLNQNATRTLTFGDNNANGSFIGTIAELTGTFRR
jgi:hypothetical protein